MIYSAVIVNIKDTNSAKRLLGLSDKKISAARVWFQETYLLLYVVHYVNTFCYV